MMTKILTVMLGVAIVLVPLNAQSSQPDVRLGDLKPQVERMTSQPSFGTFLDPDASVELNIRLPRGYTDFGIDADPFAVARV